MDPEGDRPARRAPVVLGVLALVFGGLVAAWHAFSLFTQSYLTGSPAASVLRLGHLQPNSPEAAALAEKMHHTLQVLRPYSQSMSSGMLLLSLALMGVGWGLYRRQKWARPATILWAVAALAFIPVQLYVQIVIVQPAMQVVMAQVFAHLKDGANLMAVTAGAQKGVTIAVQLLLFAPFPIALLALIGRPSAREDLLSG
ncbi:MAG TPA: hypothetical protein VII38_16290 [Polyangia bacterium]|jgi:hypothetical protein